MTAPPRTGERASWDRVLAALEARELVTRRRGDSRVEFRCPVHEDHRASGTADYRPGDPGKTLLCCHSTDCPAYRNGSPIAAALGLTDADLFDAPPPRDGRPRPSRPRPAPRPPRRTAPRAPECEHRYQPDPDYPEHVYVSAAADVLARVIRKRCTRCGGKDIRPERPGWAIADRVLYRLPEVLAAVAGGGTVYVVEGEKSADALAGLGLVATTCPFGAGKWLPQHTAALAGAARVVVIADNDRDGYAHAAYVAGELGSCSPPVAAVDVVRAAVDVAKADVVDHLEAGLAVAELVPVDPYERLAELGREADPESATGAQPAGPPAGDQPVARVNGHGNGSGPLRASESRGDDWPAHEVPMSQRRGTWLYSLGGDDWPRGVYEGPKLRAPLPYCHALVLRRDGTGQQVASEFLLSATADGPRKMIGHLAVKDGSWANELGVPLSDDPTIAQAAASAIREHAHRDAPEYEAVPRIGEAGRVSVPVPECLPPGYLMCAPGGRAAGLEGWRAVAAVAGEVPKLAAVLGASAFAPFMRALRRQSYWLELFGEPGQGKTTALTLGAAVWGAALGDDQAVRLSWNDTAIGLSRHLGSLGILPAFTDEAGMAGFAPAQWGELIFKTTEGNQRTTAERKTVQGTNRSLPWGGVLFVSGNGRVTAGLGAGKYAGLSRRVVSIAAPFTRSAVEAERLTGGYETAEGEHVPGLVDGCYGHLGGEILERYSADDARRFVAASVPLVGMLPEDAVPRTLAKHLHAAVAGAAMADDLLGTGTVLRDSAAEFARDYLAEHGVTPEHDADRIIAAVREAIAREPSRWPTRAEYAEHLRPRPEMLAEPGRIDLPQHGMARELAGVRADDGSWVAVFPEPFHDEMAAKLGVDESIALAELFRRGVLLVAKSLRARGSWLTGVRLEPKPADPVSMYKLALPELGDDDDEVTGQPGTDPRARAHEDQGGLTANPANPAGQPWYGTTNPTANPLQTPLQTPAAQARESRPQTVDRAPGFVTASDRFTAPAVVADTEAGWLARPDRLEAVPLPAPLASLADAAAWALTLRLGVARDGGMPDDAVLVILPELAARLGLPPSAPAPGSKAAEQLAALGPLREAGWQISGPGRSWSRAWRPGDRTVRIWLPGWDEYGTCPMWGDGAPATDLAYRLGLFAELAGIGWRMTGGITGVDLAEGFKRKTLRLEAAEPPKPALSGAVGHALHWSRKPMRDEAEAGWVHCYDGNGAYLAAYNTPVNVGGWRHAEAPAFDPRLPGYWLIDAPVWADPLLPDLFDPTGRARATGYTGPRWFMTPTLARAAELGYHFTPREAYLPAGEYGRYWEPFYARLRDARAAVLGSADPDARAVLDALKTVWGAAHSQIGTRTQRSRRDHDHAIIAAYSANLTRRMAAIAEQSQRWPLAIGTDALAYASADPDPVSACPPGIVLGSGLGQFKAQGTLPMAEAVPLLGSGRSADVGKLFDQAAGWQAEHERGRGDGS